MLTTAERGVFEAGAIGTRQELYSQNLRAKLIVCQVSYGKVDVEDVLAGTVGAEVVYASQDGRAFDTSQWQSGESCGDAVYVEVLRRDGRDFHGWVDAQSRKLVQAG